MRAQNNRVVAGEALDQVARLIDLLGIQSGSRFVQNEYIRIVNDGLGQANPLTVAFGQFAEKLVLYVPDCAAIANDIDALPELSAGKAFQPSNERQVFCSTHLEIERRGFGEIANPSLDFERRFDDIKTGNGCSARTGRQEARQYPHRGGLAGAIRSQKADDLASLDLERDVIHSGVAGVPLGKILHINHRFFVLKVSCPVLSPPQLAENFFEPSDCKQYPKNVQSVMSISHLNLSFCPGHRKPKFSIHKSKGVRRTGHGTVACTTR